MFLNEIITSEPKQSLSKEKKYILINYQVHARGPFETIPIIQFRAWNSDFSTIIFNEIPKENSIFRRKRQRLRAGKTRGADDEAVIGEKKIELHDVDNADHEISRGRDRGAGGGGSEEPRGIIRGRAVSTVTGF